MAKARRLAIAAVVLALPTTACSSLPSKADYGTVAVDYILATPASITYATLIRADNETIVHGYIRYPLRDEDYVGRWRLDMTVTTPDGRVAARKKVHLIALSRPKSFGRRASFVANAGKDLPAGTVIHLALSPAR